MWKIEIAMELKVNQVLKVSNIIVKGRVNYSRWLL